MESSEYAPVHMDLSRPSVGFPLGTALLLIVIFTLSAIFSCCYHWDKLPSLRRPSISFSDSDFEANHHSATAAADSPTKPLPPHTSLKQSQSLPVRMPGDRIPKFVALPSPRELPRPEKLLIPVQPKPVPPPPPPRIAVSMY